MRRGLVLGCGGTVGMAWSLATLRELQARWDWDAREADVIVGTSTGAELACALGGGVSVDDLFSAQTGSPDAPAWIADHLRNSPGRLPPRPSARLGSPQLARRALLGKTLPLAGITGLLPVGRGDTAWLTAFAERITGEAGWVDHPATWIVAADYDSGARVAFGSPTGPPATMAKALRASWAVPGWFPPVQIGEGRYVDGGVLSPASADLLATLELDEVIVLAPMASSEPGRPVGLLAGVERVLRRAMTSVLDAEIRALEASGARVTRLLPNGRDLAAMGPNLMDQRRRQMTLVSATASARERLQEGTAAVRVG